MSIDEAYEARKLAQQEFDADPCTRTANALDLAYDAVDEAEEAQQTKLHTGFGYPQFIL